MAHKQSKQALKRRAEKKHQRTVTRKAKARRSAPHAGLAGLDGVIRMDSPLPKLSERIWEYAEPLLDAATNAGAQKRAAQLAIICWNAALLPEAKVEELLRPTLQQLSGGDPRLERGLLSIYAMMIERKHEYFEDDRRLVVDFSLSDGPDGVHLMVASTQAGLGQPLAQPT
jgi:hypothetical protein